jgi:hypothetical protein
VAGSGKASRGEGVGRQRTTGGIILVQERVVLRPEARYGGDRSIKFIVAADKRWRTTGGVGRRCGVYSSVI